jgi:hypothetical protein
MSGDAVYWLKITDANIPLFDESKYFIKLPDDLSVAQKEILEVAHNDVFKEIFKVAPYPVHPVYEETRTVYGQTGNVTVTAMSRLWGQDYNVRFNNYTTKGITINGGYSWWIEASYGTVYNPSAQGGWYYDGGGDGGELQISGKYYKTIQVTFDMLNKMSQNDSCYHNNDYHVITYEIDNREVSMVNMMLADLFKRTWFSAFTDLIVNANSESINHGGETVQYGPEGGSVTWAINFESGNFPKKRNETISFANYTANGVIVNGDITFYTLVDSNGNVIDNPDESDGGYRDFYNTLHITGVRQGTAYIHTTVIKYGSIWNYTISYDVEQLRHERHFFRMSVGIGL